MSAKTAALVLGVVFVLVGAAGFFPNPLVGPDGIFAVNDMHNYVHLASGAVLVLAGLTPMAKMGLILVGVIYGAVAVLGFVMAAPDGMLLGMVHINDADRYLHVGLAAVLLIAGFILPSGDKSGGSAPT
jgi:hypothetical protein